MRIIALKIYRSLIAFSFRETPVNRFAWVIKALITLAVFSWVFFRLIGEGVSLSSYKTLSEGYGLPGLILALAGMPLNLALETMKWWFMIRKTGGSLGFKDAWKSVFAGLTTGIFTPNRIGEYAGRIAFLPPQLRIQGAVYLFVDRICQMVITLWMGMLAMEYFWKYQRKVWLDSFTLDYTSWQMIRGALFAISVLLPFAILLLPRIAKGSGNRQLRFAFFRKIATSLADLPSVVLFPVLFLGLLRYMVFSLQYVVLAYAFGFEGSGVLIFSMVWMIFLIKSVLPSITLTELGIRESVALAIMGVFLVPAHIAFSATFILYVINIILPSVLGLYYVYRLKF
ncbi:MAG: lysylphosphatidylglycerol synthase domain-containing protein [Bacteroidia bacterium]|nr:lysylphosphatidylglycerol synthase domain-containing protein [Bacteroidia bacterium]